jgi:hypothetical protein
VAVREDIRTIKEAFPHTYIFPLGRQGHDGRVVVASTAKDAISPKGLSAEAARVEARFRADLGSRRSPLPFRDMAGRLER